MTDILSFDRIGAQLPQSPVVLSVPHAGRDYPLALRAALRVPLPRLLPLEDRYVDAVAIAARETETLILQRRARAWIDLNRAEHERDWMIDDGADRQRLAYASAKVRGGLGLVPRRVPGTGELWRRRFDGDEIAARIHADHRPYHACLATALKAAHDRFGCAVLLDVHSMPPLGKGQPRIVLGDRFGRTAAARFVHRIEGVVCDEGHAVGLNAPYAGGYILERHGAPENGVHAIQLELDRSLYLDTALAEPGAGFAAATALLRRIVDALADEALSRGQALAAE